MFYRFFEVISKLERNFCFYTISRKHRNVVGRALKDLSEEKVDPRRLKTVLEENFSEKNKDLLYIRDEQFKPFSEMNRLHCSWAIKKYFLPGLGPNSYLGTLRKGDKVIWNTATKLLYVEIHNPFLLEVIFKFYKEHWNDTGYPVRANFYEDMTVVMRYAQYSADCLVKALDNYTLSCLE